MKSFDDWYKGLISDEIWFQLLRHYKDETIRKAGEKVFAQLVADSTVDVRPMSENRKHVYNILCKNPGDKPSINWAKIAYEIHNVEEEKEIKWVPVSEEEREEWLAVWKDMVDKLTMQNSMPKPSYKQLAEEGGVLPPKPQPWPATTKEEAYIRDRHFEYIKANFEARTGQKLPTWINEEDWNIQYDNENL